MPNNFVQLFSRWAGQDVEKWRAIEGQSLKHAKLGPGTILRIRQDTRGYLSLVVRFDQAIRSGPDGDTHDTRIAASSLGEFVTHLSLPQSLDEMLAKERRRLEEKRLQEEERTRRQQEEEDRRRQKEHKRADDFERLKAKYEVVGCSESSSQLYGILKGLEEANRLTSKDEKWLEERRLYPPLAIYHLGRRRVAKAGSLWRRAHMPYRALEISEGVLGDPAVLTMRGGAFRDTKDLAQAEDCARGALALRESFHPHCLLAAIYFQRGRPEQGYTHVQQAVKLGAELWGVEKELRPAIEAADDDAKRRGARYLLDLDPEKYAWAERYL